MSVTIAGNPLKKMTHIGQTVTKWVHDGVTVFNSRTPTNPMLLNYSDQIVPGGWNINNLDGYVYFQGYYNADSTFLQGWRMSYSGNGGYGRGWMCTANKIRLSGWKTLTLRLQYVQGYGAAEKTSGVCYVALTTTPNYVGGRSGDDAHATSGVVKYISYWYSDPSGIGDLTLDISGIDGEYYIQIGRYNAEYGKTFSTVFQYLTLGE